MSSNHADPERQRLEGLITPELLQATDVAFMQAWRESEGQHNEERGRRGRVAQIEVLVSALLVVPTECRHGVPLEHNCNACSDEAARPGGRPNPRPPELGAKPHDRRESGIETSRR